MCLTLVTLLLASVAFAQDTESVATSDESALLGELGNKLFGANSRPLNPEEAREDIKRIHKHTAYYSSLANGLARLEQRVEECNFEDTPGSDDWQANDSKYFDLSEPALQPYLKSLRARMVQCFRGNMKEAVRTFSSMASADKRGTYAYLRDSLANMPLELFVDQNFIETKDERISNALVGVVDNIYGEPYLCEYRYFYTQLFVGMVDDFCRKIVRIVLVPPSIQSVVYRKEDTVAMLGKDVVEWAKVHHLCKQLTSKPRAAAKIVYRRYLELRSRRKSLANTTSRTQLIAANKS